MMSGRWMIGMILAMAGGTAAMARMPAIPVLGAEEAGARYGQARGAALVCRGLAAGPRLEKLRANYAGEDRAVFDRRAEEIVKAWRKMVSCEEAPEINMCRLLKERNCHDAEAQIGPGGSAVPGLVVKKEE